MTSATPSLFDVRRSGVLLHPTSLPGPHGCGDFGAEAYHFVDWLLTAGQTLWQVLPLNPVGAGNSPYQSVSVFAGNPMLVDLAPLVERGWLDHPPPHDFERMPVDYGRVAPARMAALQYGAMKEPLGSWRHEEPGDAGGPCRFAEYCNALRIAPERRGIPAGPCEGGHLVQESGIPRDPLRRFRGERRMGQEAEWPEAIVDRDDDGAKAGQLLPVEEDRGTGPGREAAAMDPEHHRGGRAGAVRRPDIE